MARQSWSRDETLVALNIYCRTPFGRLHGRNPEIIEVATALGRTPNALAMKCCNLAAFDPAQQARGIRGLSKASILDQQIWAEFTANPEDLAFEAEVAFARLTNRQVRVAEDVQWEDVRGIDRETLTKVRVNQQFFRSMILAGYRGRCAICELPIAALLVASHIVPWSIDKTLRMNPKNGICFCTLHDRAFDRGLIAIANDYTISVHERIANQPVTRTVDDYFLRFAGRSIILPDRWHPDPVLLQRQRECVAPLLDAALVRPGEAN